MREKKHQKISFRKQLSIWTHQYWLTVSFLLLLLAHIFFQFYNLYPWIQFGWDQTDSAWAAKRIIIDHGLPLIGSVAKGNTGIFVGPLYYYYISIFYWFTNMSPIASPIAAGVASIITFIGLFFLVKKIFSPQVALIAVSIDTFSSFIIFGDRVQWQVSFVPIISVLIFYALYRVLQGRVKFIILLALGIGLSLQAHFTSVFYFPILFLTLPFFPRRKSTILYSIIGVGIIFLFFLPIIISNAQQHNSQASSLANYLHTYYHGFHLRRVLQLTHDAFIEYILILRFQFVNYICAIFLPLFSLIYYLRNRNRNSIFLIYLCWLWFLIPWLAFSTYSGELTNYYFYMTRPIVLMTIGYLTYVLILQRYFVVRLAIIGFWALYLYTNTLDFSSHQSYGLIDADKIARTHVQTGKPILPNQNIPESYLYWLYTRGK